MASFSDGISVASNEFVISAGARLGSLNVSYPFIDLTSRLLAENVAKYIDSLGDGVIAPTDSQNFAEYLALGASYHLLEGWRNLSQATYALLNGASRIALHLSYYAELRAARSLLACREIFIGNKKHYCIDNNGTIIPLEQETKPKQLSIGARILGPVFRTLGIVDDAAKPPSVGTHVAAWIAAREWAMLEENGALLVDVLPALHYKGIEWADACRVTHSRKLIGADWLNNWSVDLKQLQIDSSSRNIASYGIDLDNTAFAPLDSNQFELICDLNDASLELPLGDIDSLDLMLLHEFCFNSSKITLDPKPTSRRDRRIWLRLARWLENEGGYAAADARDLVNAIKDIPNSSAGRLLHRARIKNRAVDGVMSRGFLLLRLATAIHKHLWNEMRPRAQSGNISWHSILKADFAVHCNLATAAAPVMPADFQIDQEQALTESRDWVQTNGFDSFSLWANQNSNLRQISRVETIGLWLL